MLVSDFVHIERPFPELCAELCASGPAWLGSTAVAAYRQGERLSMTVLAPVGPITFSKRVIVEFEPARCSAERLVQPVRWEAAGARCLFPTMDAELEFSPLGPALTAVRLTGSYFPPLGPLGREMNRVLLFRLAEASMRSFLSGIVERLAPQPTPTAWAGGMAPEAV